MSDEQGGPEVRPVEGTRLTLVRHCATPLNEARQYQGHEDVGLSSAGRDMARDMGIELAGREIAPDRVWVSDLRRAWETAELALPGVAQDRDVRLRELNFGAFSGATYDENLATHGEVFRRWLQDPDAFPPPNGERLGDLWARVVSWAETLTPGRDAVAVLHVGSMKAVVSWALRLPFQEVIPRHLPIGAVIVLRVVDGAWRPVSGWDEAETPRTRPSATPRPGRGAAWPGAENNHRDTDSEA